jgi:hypothetical protein
LPASIPRPVPKWESIGYQLLISLKLPLQADRPSCAGRASAQVVTLIWFWRAVLVQVIESLEDASGASHQVQGLPQPPWHRGQLATWRERARHGEHWHKSGGPLTSAACLARSANRARLCLSH